MMDGIKTLFYNLSLIITGAIYPTIPKLYKLFEWTVTFKFLDDKYVKTVWNNIYVFVAVIVLFAIAVKLISTMVNPDTMSDNKKGVKGYYFRSVAAVVLIFIIPMIFDYSFKLQEELISNNYLVGRVFGYEIEKGTNVGQILAWETFSSFCAPFEETNIDVVGVGKVAIEVEPDNQQKALYFETQKNMDLIGAFLTHMRLSENTINNLLVKPIAGGKVKLKFGYNYNSILCPLAGLLVAYEMLLLCMDTMFRSAKLAFLELMLPIVLGAFVFNPDILKKWAKEFFATYITSFLKILAIGFMIISFSAVQGLMNKNGNFFNDWLLNGLFKIIFIISLLQLIKKVPDLINSIFGTNIKSAGGIKGRLGEMAGIGGLAQKAWAGLGNITKVAAAGLAGVAAYGGYKLATGDAKGKRGFEGLVNRLKTGSDIRDNKIVRGVRGGIAAVQSAAKTGSVSSTTDAFTRAQAPVNVSTAQRLRMNKDEMQSIHDASAVDVGGGTIAHMFDENGVLKNTYTDANGKEQYFNADQINQVRQNITSRLNKYGKAGQKKAAIISTNLNKALYEGMLKKNETAVSGFRSFADSYANGASEEERQMAQSIANAIDNGTSLSEEQISFIRTNKSNEYLSQTITAYEKMLKQQGAMGLTAANTGSVAMKTMISNLDGTVASLKRDYDIEASSLSQTDRDRMDIIESSLNASNASMAPTLQNNTWISREQTYTGGTVSVRTPNGVLEGNATPNRVQYLYNVTAGLIEPTASDYGVSPTVFDAAKAQGHEIGSIDFEQDIVREATNAGYSQADIVAITARANVITSFKTGPAEAIGTFASKADAQQYYDYVKGLADNEVTAATSEFTAANNAFISAESEYNSAQAATSTATTTFNNAESDFNNASTEYSAAEAALVAAEEDLKLAQASGRSSAVSAARQAYDAAKIDADRKKQARDSFEQAVKEAQAALDSAIENESSKFDIKTAAENAKNNASARQTTATNKRNAIVNAYNNRP